MNETVSIVGKHRFVRLFFLIEAAIEDGIEVDELARFVGVLCTIQRGA